MNRLFKFSLVIFFLMTSIVISNAQVQIVSSDFRYEQGNDLSKQKSQDNIEVDLGEAGANQSWDFSGIELEGDYVNYIDHIRDPEGKPGAESFPAANIVAWSDYGINNPYMIYSYLIINEDNFNHLGMAFDSDEPDTTMIWQVETTGNALNFPMAYNDEWDYVLNFGTDEQMNIDSVHCVVDAWGTITDLAGTFDCIRVQRTTRGFEQHDEEIETDNHIDYLWIVPDFGDIVTISSEDGEEDPDFTSGSFTRLTGVEMTGISSRTELEIPTLTCLEPAYPNPFNSTTTINFSLPQAGQVNLAVFDINGRQVATLVEGHLIAGYHRSVLIGDNLQSGLYLVRMTTLGETHTAKLMLVK